VAALSNDEYRELSGPKLSPEQTPEPMKAELP